MRDPCEKGKQASEAFPYKIRYAKRVKNMTENRRRESVLEIGGVHGIIDKEYNGAEFRCRK